MWMRDTFTGDYSYIMNKFIKEHLVDIIVFAIFFIFFGYLYIAGEPVYLGDTFQHDNQFLTREPVYALLLQVMRFFAPESYYEGVIFIQNLLAIGANTFFVCFVYRYFKTKPYFAFIITLIMLSVHIFTPMASSTGMVITNSLLSEGITYSLYLFFVAELLKLIRSKKALGRYSIGTLLWALFLSLIRGQLMTLLVVWLIAVSACVIFDKENRENKKNTEIQKNKGLKLAALVILFAASFVSRGLVIKTYNYLEQGFFVNTVSGQAMAVANVLYAAQREDGEAIEDDSLRELFYRIYDKADSDSMNCKYSEKGLIRRGIHHEKCHDLLNFEYFNVEAKEYIEKNRGISVVDYQRMMIEVDRVADELIKELLPGVLGRYIYNYIAIITIGFIRTVAFVNPLLNWYALLIYAIAVSMLVYSAKNKGLRSEAVSFMAVTLLMIAGNVSATALMIQCISRYMIYNLPIFYIALLMLIKENISVKNKKQNKKT